MTLARRQLVSLDHTPYYHCTARCVRRAFLCGKDRFSGKSFEHRRGWIEARLRHLSDIFAIELLAYAVMSNHYHVVVRLTPEVVENWTDDEVIKRWGFLYRSDAGVVSEDRIAIWRQRLADLSWYMRSINEPLARRANREDDCRGRFWEGRFKSQALLDEQALIKCMAYVDLNPIRAGIARTPEESTHTSIKARIGRKATHIASFNTGEPDGRPAITLKDYLTLIDLTGRQLRTDKRGAIPEHLPPILERLGINHKTWLTEMQHYGRWYYRAVGSADAMLGLCEQLGQRWLKGIGSARAACA